MSDNVKITITGTNNASPAFQSVARDAQAMGNTVEQAGQRSARSFDDFNRRAAALGAGIGTLVGVMSDWSRQAIEDAANQSRLQQAVENTGKSYDQYSIAIEKAIQSGQDKAFTDDQVRDALVKLNAVTNDTAASLNQLGLVEDFARARGIDLATAADIIGKVYGGNTGILARYGIQLDKNATSEQALAKIQQISAGQAQTYADTTQGKLEAMRIGWDETTEAIGRHTGALQGVLAILPGLSAGFTGLSAAIAGIGGAGGLAALGSLGAAVALLAGGAAAGYSANTNVGGWGDNLFANVAIGGAGIANWLTPGNAFSGVQGQFQDLKSGDNFTKAINNLIYAPAGTPKDDPAYIIGQLKEAGVLPPTFNGSVADAADYISQKATSVGLSNQQYVVGQVGKSGAYKYDPVSNQYIANGSYYPVMNSRYFAQGGNLTSGATTMAYGSLGGATAPSAGDGYGQWVGRRPGTARASMYGEGANAAVSSAGGSGAVANDISGQVAVTRQPLQFSDSEKAAQNHREIADALGAENAAYVDLASGIGTAASAQSAFKATQDGLLQSETVYSQQLSEYSGQVDAITKAHDLLNQKVADGIPLTAQQQKFQDNYNEALERGQGAIDDATISQGMLAESYLLNMEKGDQLNQTMATQSAATSNLVGVIQELILSLDGVPSDVVTQIRLDMSQADPTNLALYVAYLNSIPSSVSTVIESVYVTSGSPATGGAGGAGRGAAGRLGGVMGYANGGLAIYAAEAGPELMHFRGGGSALAMTPGMYGVPNGTYVDTAPVTKQKLGRGGGHSFNIQNLTVIANDPQQFTNALSEWAIGNAR